jgi:glycosyltransferase involved in cell wall biosynthesis
MGAERRVRLLVDARAIGRSGIGRYTHVAIDALLRDDRFSEIHLVGEPGALEPYLSVADSRVRISRLPTAFYSPRFQQEWQRRSLCGELDADFFFPHYDAPVRVPTRSVVAVHDLIHFNLPHIFPRWKRAAASFLLKRVVERASHVVVLSHSTRSDLVERIPGSEGKTSVVPLGFDPDFLRDEPIPFESLAYAETLQPFCLCVGNRKPHKNLMAAVEALALIRKTIAEMKLVIAGVPYPGWEDVVSRAETLGVSDAIVDLVNTPDETLNALYARCSCLLFPSLYEGLGLPILEAFARGAPVIASNRSSVPDPTSPERIAAAVLSLRDEPGLKDRLIQRGRERCVEFDWDRAAAGLADLLYSVAVADRESIRHGWRHPVDFWPRSRVF